MKFTPSWHLSHAIAGFLIFVAGGQASAGPAAAPVAATETKPAPRYLSEPLIRHLYTADPAAHVFAGRLYLYPSHDIPGVTDRPDGNHYAMRDYHVYSLDKVGAPVTDHGVAFAREDVPWASRQLWAPAIAEANGRYYLYFPARDKEQVFRIGVAVGNAPTGPFKPEPRPMQGAFSIDPATFRDDDGAHYLYFGGIVLLDSVGQPLLAGDEDRRFFEGAWVHKHNGVYYFSYSTGTKHRIVYATGASPYGPFTYRGVILKPVQGWTTHQSIVQHDGKWWLLYHDTQLSGQNNLRNVKVTELHHEADGRIRTIDPLPGR